ncbi:hypothetical protein TNIN_400491 [Trichonephila inaurata madagascariensis]|uniref:Uncharacterized protein n=1 Tax=Trichonephila inaurata madagascariensis TaxID=2747483 RepID=A0A8X6XI40_9ARAC|nr:hypothetical protein TNIN_400491 [Trichonephila inaurata madagascariensis]
MEKIAQFQPPINSTISTPRTGLFHPVSSSAIRHPRHRRPHHHFDYYNSPASQPCFAPPLRDFQRSGQYSYLPVIDGGNPRSRFRVLRKFSQIWD